jgi:hypothetical protein
MHDLAHVLGCQMGSELGGILMDFTPEENQIFNSFFEPSNQAPPSTIPHQQNPIIFNNVFKHNTVQDSRCKKWNIKETLL